MSEPKLISPLLDGFAMGAPMSDHDGVRCCPAMKENSDSKYIVKIISVPASQVQLDALLLTGAYHDPGEAMDYFKELADGVVKEAEFLKKLAKLEGFLSYDGWQIVPMDNNDLGYDVYLYSPYKQSLEKFTRKNPMTHLGAINLGLDMCAALGICRRAGRIYVDLKPTNIFISEDKEYRIGDLGFVELSGLKYATLPSKYRSAYTAPELHDPMVTLNTTADVYSVGMILYQIYNNGKLPYDTYAEAEVYPTPENADYELAEIIMKAIAPDPKDRWQNPIEMGRALVAYMQRNTVNDVPITPPTASVAGFTPISEDAPPQKPADETESSGEGDEFDFMSGIVSDETAPGEEDAADAEDRPISDETTSMLAQADGLLEQAGPVVAAGSEDNQPAAKTQQPADNAAEKADPKESAKAAPVATPADDDDLFGDSDGEDDQDDDDEEDGDDDKDSDSKPKKKGWIAFVIIALVLALLGTGGFIFYKYYYQLTIDELHVEPFEDQVTVVVDTEIDTALLTVVCTDIHGTVQQLPLTDGQAVFTDLLADTQYKIQLEVSGFHALVGSTSSTFSTPAVTEITGITAATGETDGSVVLSFDLVGPRTEDWVVTYSTEGEEAQSQPFTGNMVTIEGLTVGKTYLFELTPVAELYMTGENTLEFTASAIILAENLAITDYSGGNLTVQWTAPEGVTPEGWIVRCYSDDGSNSETIETTETTLTFSGIDTANAYTVEVTAKGMTQSARTHVSANPTNITAFHVDESNLGKLVITWEYEGSYPENGWLLMYTVDNIEKQMVISSEGARAEISPRIPGATYHFELQSVSGSSVFHNTYSHACAEAKKFEDYEMLVDFSDYYLCKTPENPNWKYSDVKRQDYTTTFAPGEPVSMIIKTATHFIPRETVNILYVIRDAEGNAICELSASENVNWYQLWVDHYPYTTLDIPQVPQEPGTYKLCLYFNYKYVTIVEFTISE